MLRLHVSSRTVVATLLGGILFAGCMPIARVQPRQNIGQVAVTDPEFLLYKQQLGSSMLDDAAKRGAEAALFKRLEIVRNATTFLNESTQTLEKNVQMQRDASRVQGYFLVGTGASSLTVLIEPFFAAIPIATGLISGIWTEIVDAKFTDEIEGGRKLNEKVTEILSPPQQTELHRLFGDMVRPFVEPPGFSALLEADKEKERKQQRDQARTTYSEWEIKMNDLNVKGSIFVGVSPPPAIR